MRIAIIGSPWVPVPPPAYGGTETVLAALVNGLAVRGHEICYLGHPDSQLPAQVICPIPAQNIGHIGDAACELAHVTLAYELAAGWGADVTHDHTLTGPLVGPATGPVVVTNHGPFDGLTTPIFERVGARARLVAISHGQADTAPSVPVHAVVHHGLDVDDWPLGTGDGDYLLFLGRMHATKGVHRAVDLAREAGVPLVLAAKMREGPEHDYFDHEVRPRLHGDAHFVGEADATMKRRLLAEARALLNPISWPEPFGMVMVEALACGTPVLVPPLGAAPEIVEHGVTGYLCATRRAFLSGIEGARHLDRARCRLSVVERFPVASMVRGYEAVYADAIAERRRLRRDHSAHPSASMVQWDDRPATDTESRSTITSTR